MRPITHNHSLALMLIFSAVLIAMISPSQSAEIRAMSTDGAPLASQTATAMSASSLARFQGTAYQGLDEESVRLGGATVTVQLLATDLIFNFSKSKYLDMRDALVATSFFSPPTSTSQLSWNTCVQTALSSSRVSLSNGNRLLKVTLGPAPLCTISQNVVTINIALATEFVTAAPASAATAFLDVHRNITGPSLAVIPKSRLSFKLVGDQDVVAGNMVTLQIIGEEPNDVPSNPGFQVVEGTNCKGVHASSLEETNWDSRLRHFSFRPTLGGALSICYTPIQDNPSVVVKAIGSLVVWGPEGLTTDPAVPRAQTEFSGMIYGTNLTDQDILVITSEGSCLNVQGETDNFDISLSSSARAVFWANVPVQGTYQVCYQRVGSERFVRVGSIQLNKGSEMIVDKDIPQLLVDQNALVVRNTRISFLTLQAGHLAIDNYQLNVTHFVWTGGSLGGPGSVNCMGSNSKISALTESRVIEGVIRNFGTMEIDMRHLVFSGRGSFYNYGDVTILVNSSGPEDPATMQGAGRANVLVNGVNGKVTFRFLTPGGSLQISMLVENRGVIVIAPYSLLSFSDLTLTQGSGVLETSHYSMVLIRNAKVLGRLIIHEESDIKLLGDVSLRRCDITGAGTLSIVSGIVALDSVTTDSSITFVVDGGEDSTLSSTSYRHRWDEEEFVDSSQHDNSWSGPSIRVSLFGTNILGRQTKSLFRNAEFSATDLTKLVFEGKLVCHIPSVVFGSNIIVQSNLATVMFGSGSEEESIRAKLVPQRMPQNSSFVVPPNSTLVIMNTGNLTQQAIATLRTSPKVCAYYVVVPMHVEVNGKVLLWGCAMLPFGATVNGIIYGTNAKEIEATVEYAFCRNVLLNPNICVPLFPATEVGTNPPHVISGVKVGGQVTTAGLKLPNPAINLDYFGLLDGTMRIQDPMSLIAYKRIEIDRGSTMIISNGGVFGTASLEVNGALQVRGELPLLLHGTLEVGTGGVVAIDIDTSMCKVPLQVSEDSLFHPGSELRCVSAANRTVGSGGLISFESIAGFPNLRTETCAANNNEIAIRVAASPHQVGVKFVERASVPPTRVKIAVLSISIGVAVVIVVLLQYLLQISCQRFVQELKAECALSLHLSWPEFSSFVANTLVVLGFLAEALFFSMPAFHAAVPLPIEVSYFIRTSMNFMLPHRNASCPMLTALCIIAIALWFMTWIPLSGKKLSGVVKNLTTNAESTAQRYLVQLLFQFHTLMSFWAGLILFPVLTHLLEAVACGTFLSDMSNCDDVGSMASPAGIATIMFVVLAPFSAHGKNFAFGHPPYHRTLDIRFKRSYSVLHTPLVFLQVILWKVFANDPVPLLLMSLALVLVDAMMYKLSRPCAYQNINAVHLVAYLIPIWSILTSLFQVSRFGPGSKFICSEGDPLYLVLFFLGKGLVVAWIVYAMRRCSADYDSLSCDPAIDASLKALTMTYYQIEDLRVEMYNTNRSSRREVISNNIVKLRIDYLEKLRLFRNNKERYLIPFYLGVDASTMGLLTSTSRHDTFPHDEDEMMRSFPPRSPRSPEGFEDPVKPITTSRGSPLEPGAATPRTARAFAAQQHQGRDESEDMDWILHPDEMDRFHCGPQLGRGSYGTVHMGMLPSGRLVAVKVIQIVKKKKDQLNAVKLEVNMLRSLTHPNIIRYFGCHASGGYMRVFMEFAVGGSLTSLVRKFEKLSEPVMRYYTHQILSGLAFLHSRHVVHRDIKGENILIDGHGVAKLADFGCSKGLADIANRSQNGCGTLVGSPYWMAPEVIKNEAYGTKADIWSVGCTVVEMLNGGDPPWHEKFDNVYSAMFFIASTTEIPSNIPSDVSSLCRDFLARCFERDVSKRSSALELLQHPWLQDLPSTADGGSSSGGSANNTPKVVERQWSDMFDSDSAKGSNATTHDPSADGTIEPREGSESMCGAAGVREDGEERSESTHENSGSDTLTNQESMIV